MKNPRYSLFHWIESLLLTLLCLALVQSQWTGAFAYEFSFLLGVASSLILMVTGSIRLNRIKKHRSLQPNDFIRALAANLLILLIPLGIVLLFSIKNTTCQYGIGFVWFVLLPVVSVIFATSCAIWAQQFSTSPWKTILWTLAPCCLFSILLLHDLWVGPSLSFLHPMFGYFPGPIYDEWIPIESHIVLYRAWIVLLSLWMIVQTMTHHKQNQRIQEKIGLFFLSILVFVPLLMRTQLGWSQNYHSVHKALPLEKKSQHIALHYHPITFSDLQAQEFLLTLEYLSTIIIEKLELSTNSNQRVSVYVYPSHSIKKYLTGTRYTSVGNPFQRAVHILKTSPHDTLLKHELTHVWASEFGDPVFGISFCIGLLEGLATAMEGYRENLSIHEWAKSMLMTHDLPNMETLFTFSGFWKQAASKAYLSAGSFCDWLIQTKGIAFFKKVYAGKNFKQVYGLSFQELLNQWKLFLGSIPVSNQIVEQTEPARKSLPISKRQCPHDVAQALALGRKNLEQNNLHCATDFFSQAYIFSGKTPLTALSYVRSLLRGKNIPKAQSLVHQISNNPTITQDQKALSIIFLGDTKVIQQRYDQAQQYYTQALDKNIDFDLQWMALAKTELLKNNLISLLQQWIVEGPSKPWLEKISNQSMTKTSSLLLFLAAKFYANQGQYKEAWKIIQPWDKKTFHNKASFVTKKAWQLYAQIAQANQQYLIAIHAYKQLERLSTTQGEKILCKTQMDYLEYRSGLKRHFHGVFK